jgi:tetratricopeptide (TPR) repeat protein
MPQPANRIKLRRKDIRQPDEFQTITSQVAAWVRDHRGLVAGVAGGIAAIALVGLVLERSAAARDDAAATAFRSAHRTFAAAKYAEAAPAFEAVAREYPRAPFGRLAALYRGHALARQGDAGAAATAYSEYLAGSPEPAYLRQEALTALGRVRETGGDAAAALEAYTQAGAFEGPYRTDALLAAARLHEAAGRAAEARAVYRQLLEVGPDAELRSLLLAKLPGEDAGATDPAREPQADADVR